MPTEDKDTNGSSERKALDGEQARQSGAVDPPAVEKPEAVVARMERELLAIAERSDFSSAAWCAALDAAMTGIRALVLLTPADIERVRKWSVQAGKEGLGYTPPPGSDQEAEADQLVAIGWEAAVNTAGFRGITGRPMGDDADRAGRKLKTAREMDELGLERGLTSSPLHAEGFETARRFILKGLALLGLARFGPTVDDLKAMLSRYELREQGRIGTPGTSGDVALVAEIFARARSRKTGEIFEDVLDREKERLKKALPKVLPKR